jgi:hypothetical protein
MAESYLGQEEFKVSREILFQSKEMLKD